MGLPALVIGLAAVVVGAFAACGGGDGGNEDGTISVDPVQAGFNGTPSIRVLREHYGITPG